VLGAEGLCRLPLHFGCFRRVKHGLVLAGCLAGADFPSALSPVKVDDLRTACMPSTHKVVVALSGEY
jgi:hypothetical protein